MALTNENKLKQEKISLTGKSKVMMVILLADEMEEMQTVLNQIPGVVFTTWFKNRHFMGTPPPLPCVYEL